MPESLNIKDHNRLILVTLSSPPKHEVGNAETGKRPRPNKGTELCGGREDAYGRDYGRDRYYEPSGYE
jgi:hypothetical protein